MICALDPYLTSWKIFGDPAFGPAAAIYAGTLFAVAQSLVAIAWAIKDFGYVNIAVICEQAVGKKAVGVWHCLKSLNPDRITAVTGTRTLVGVWRIHVAEGELTVIVLTIDNAGEGTGPEMAEADNAFGLTLGLFERREYNRHKHRDNGDDNKQLYEGKSLAHFTSPNGLYPVDDLQIISITIAVESHF